MYPSAGVICPDPTLFLKRNSGEVIIYKEDFWSPVKIMKFLSLLPNLTERKDVFYTHHH